MPSTIDIRRRIRSVKSTQQITKAMKMVAAAKLRHAQEQIFAARPYAAGLREVLSSVAARVEDVAHPLLEQREVEKNVILVVITADRGLCGAFNTNVVRAATHAVRERGWESVRLLPIGRKAIDLSKRRGLEVIRPTLLIDALHETTAREIAQLLADEFTSGNVDAVYIIFNEFRSIMAQVTQIEKLLPISRAFDATEAPALDYLYAPSPIEILNQLLPKHIGHQFYRALLESAASEQGARMTAMEAATKNASEMIEALTLKYNGIRQAAITKEIIEIVSGAAAAEG